MKPENLVWEDPPTPRHGNAEWPLVLDRLKGNPNRWAKLPYQGKTPLAAVQRASAIRSRYGKEYPGLEIRVEGNNLWGRIVSEAADA